MNGEQRLESPLSPGVLSCYSHAWNIMREKFLEFFVITVIAIALTLPTAGLSLKDEIPPFFAMQLFSFSLLYTLVLFWPLEYGIDFAFLKGTRGEDVKVNDIFEVFKNYLNAVLAHFIVGAIIGIGILCCFVPGIVFACKLAFVPYLVVDRKMDVINALKESWRLTTGHSMTVFLIGLVSVPIFIAGLMICFVGVIISAMWVELAFASLYWSVARSAEPGYANNRKV